MSSTVSLTHAKHVPVHILFTRTPLMNYLF